MTTTEAPLAGFQILRVQENWIGINAGTPVARQVPGGSCWHCGTGIAIEVVIRNSETGETHTIGTTCAERVGLDAKELKAMLAEKYAEERYERSAAVRRQREQEAAERETRETAEHGSHGTESRYLSGCWCDMCRKVAPHGTCTRFFDAKCHCLTCVENILTERPDEFYVHPKWDVIVDMETGGVVSARKVNTRYGYRWCVRDGLAWLPVQPARRSTLAKKGYTEAEVPMLVERCGRGRDSWLKPICRMADPVADRWGESIIRQAEETP